MQFPPRDSGVAALRCQRERRLPMTICLQNDLSDPAYARRQVEVRIGKNLHVCRGPAQAALPCLNYFFDKHQVGHRATLTFVLQEYPSIQVLLQH